MFYLYRLVSSGQAAPGRLDGIGQRAKDQLREVFGQRKLLTWSVPGVAHFLTFWAFIVLAATILEAYGALFDRDFAIPVIGRWALLGFLEDFFAVAVLAALVAFSVIRLRNAPSRKERGSRFYGSHTRAAWVVLFMIFNVIWTLLLLRGAQINTGVFPFQEDGWWAFASKSVAEVLEPLGEDTNEVLETLGILGQIGVILGFLVIVVYSKHLHIFLAFPNVYFSQLTPKGKFPINEVVHGEVKAMMDPSAMSEPGKFTPGRPSDSMPARIACSSTPASISAPSVMSPLMPANGSKISMLTGSRQVRCPPLRADRRPAVVGRGRQGRDVRSGQQAAAAQDRDDVRDAGQAHRDLQARSAHERGPAAGPGAPLPARQEWRGRA